MFKKLTGILILLSFLLIKSTSLLASDHHQHAISCCAGQGADDAADAEKETKQLEIADEDLLIQPALGPAFLVLSKKPAHLTVPDIQAPYLSLPYPPPNGHIL